MNCYIGGWVLGWCKKKPLLQFKTSFEFSSYLRKREEERGTFENWDCLVVFLLLILTMVLAEILFSFYANSCLFLLGKRRLPKIHYFTVTWCPTSTCCHLMWVPWYSGYHHWLARQGLPAQIPPLLHHWQGDFFIIYLFHLLLFIN